jgi:hypothetical protein
MTDVGVKWGFNGRGRWAHAGVLRAADAMREEIEESQILTRIYEHLLPDFCNVGLSQPIFQHVRCLVYIPFFNFNTIELIMSFKR